MSTEIPIPLTKVDSAIEHGDASPNESKIKHRRTSSTVSGVFNINDLGKLLQRNSARLRYGHMKLLEAV